MVRLLDRQTVASVYDIKAAIATTRAAFIALDQSKAVMPQRVATQVDRHEGIHLSMPCYVDDEPDVLSIKVATVFKGNLPNHGLPTTMAFLLLHDARTGELISLMDAEHLTAMRTGAASALATDLLAQPDASVVTVFGAGAQAESQLLAVKAVRPIKKVYVVGRNPGRTKGFAKRMEENFEFEVQPESNIKEALKKSQVVCAATNAVKPVFNGRDLQPGTHVNGVGSFRADMRELDEETLARSRVYVDRLTAAQQGAGDLIHAVANGRLVWDSVGELGGLLTGRTPGRQDPSEMTVFKSVGLAVQDAFAASWIYERAVKQDLGVPFALS
ncbi:ornithine cyclodeaminase family protein [bacterium]|nr:MAG: ornithine cyclodeaminase family protein [bacterium]